MYVQYCMYVWCERARITTSDNKKYHTTTRTNVLVFSMKTKHVPS